MNLGAVVPLISGTTAHPSGTTAGGAEHGTKRGRAEQSTTAEMQKRYYRPTGAVLPLRRYHRALLSCNYC